MNEETAGNRYRPWLEVIRLTTDEGCEWAARFDRHSQLLTWLDEALALFRQSQNQEGLALVNRCSYSLATQGDLEPSIQLVLERWIHGTLAYSALRQGNHIRSLCELDLAMSKLESVINMNVALLPLALQAHELLLHRARVYRDSGDQERTRALLQLGVYMALDREPLCCCRAKPVFFHTVSIFCGSLTNGKLAGDLINLFSPQSRLLTCRVFTASILNAPRYEDGHA